jgi:hypothetical protein
MVVRPKRLKKKDDTRLRELILYIAERCQYQEKFGATKLNKVLFYSDFLAYAKFGKPITGEEYFKLQYGPAPKRMVPVQEKMERAGDIVIVKRMTRKGPQTRIIPKREATLSSFKPEEIALVDEIIFELEHKDAEEVSDFSHFFIGWQIAKDKETIPYETVFLTDLPEHDFTEHEIRKAEEIAQRYGLAAST